MAADLGHDYACYTCGSCWTLPTSYHVHFRQFVSQCPGRYGTSRTFTSTFKELSPCLSWPLPFTGYKSNSECTIFAASLTSTSCLYQSHIWSAKPSWFCPSTSAALPYHRFILWLYLLLNSLLAQTIIHPRPEHKTGGKPGSGGMGYLGSGCYSKYASATSEKFCQSAQKWGQGPRLEMSQ